MSRSVTLLLLLLMSVPAFATDQPNIVVFLTDDQGWGDLGCYGHPRIKSPNLDQFASEGLRLTQCYSACAVCSPSRSAIQTGRTPYRNGVWRWIPEGSQYHLRSSEITIASLLKEQGYDTCHVGKWHLNGKFNSDEQPQPDDHGYDHWLATQNNAAPHHLNPVNYVRNRDPVGRMEGPSSVVAVEEAIKWLKSREDQERPYFLTVWTHEPHLPIESAEKFMEPYSDIEDEGIRQHHGNITQMDHAFGLLMKAIDQREERDETVVFFTSDNGPEGSGDKGRTRGSTGGLRGRKRHSHEGGIRVPGIIRWPGHVQPGTESDTPVIGSDIFTTICDIVDIPLPKDRTIDGASILPLFEGKPFERSEPLYWRNHLAPEQYRVALRIEDWKIIGNDDLTAFKLYNIAKDQQETEDLSEMYPDKFEEMKQQLIEQDRQVLEDGPDWWKDDPPKKKKRQSAKLTPGENRIDDDAVVLGGILDKSELGYKLTTDAEAMALWKVKSMTRGTIRVTYQSLVKDSKTRNALLCLGSKPTNENTVKIGTAIGLGQHVIFDGGWNNVGSLAKKTGKFEPLDQFDCEVRFDCEKHTIEATINGTPIKANLPTSIKEIRYTGFYTKGTSTGFTSLKIEND